MWGGKDSFQKVLVNGARDTAAGLYMNGQQLEEVDSWRYTPKRWEISNRDQNQNSHGNIIHDKTRHHLQK